MAWILATAPAAGQTSQAEFAIKAAFLTRFSSYVDWPAAALPTPQSPVTICIVGHDPFGALIDQAADLQADQRRVVVRRLERIDPGSGCQLAYIGGGQDVGGALEAIGDEPVLTVTDEAAGPSPRGAVHFTVAEDRVRFHIDEADAARKGLSLRSSLLNVALTVRRRDPP